MKSIKIFFSILLVSCFTMTFTTTMNAQNELEAMLELLQGLNENQKKDILEYAKQQETDYASEILTILSRLPKDRQQLLLEYAYTVNQSSTPTQANLPIPPKQDKAVPSHNHGPTTTMTFKSPTHDFGTVEEGAKVKHTFTFQNTGSEPLIISNAQGSCGCTVPAWPKEPVAPGATGQITVEFNSESKPGKRNQQVTITANTEPHSTVISLVGNVTPKQK
jgi:hypothetical protein